MSSDLEPPLEARSAGVSADASPRVLSRLSAAISDA